MAVFVKKMTFSIKNKCIVFLKHVRWPREINVLQLQKTHANRKSISKSRKHLHQFDSRCCKCTQHKRIKRHAANAHNQGRRYGFWAPWTAYSLGPSCVLGGGGYGGWRWLVWIWVPILTDRSSGVVGLPLHTDHVPVESPSVEIAIVPGRARVSNLGPSPAHVRQLNKITGRVKPVFSSPSPKDYNTVSAIKIVQFCM